MSRSSPNSTKVTPWGAADLAATPTSGLVTQTAVEMDRGFLFVMSISDGSCLAVLAAATCNVAVVAYEMTVLVARAGDVLTPSLRAELQAILPT